MGSSKSKYPKPNSAIEMMQLKEEQKARKLAAEQKRAAKLAKQKNKTKKKKKNTEKLKSPESQQSKTVSASNAHIRMLFEDYQRAVDLELHKQITESYSNFVLNQILLSLQFFVNYEQEVTIAYERVFLRENEKNRNLDKHSIIFPNALDDAVSCRIRYQERHGTRKNEQFPLQTQTMYVIFENVEISKPDDGNYDSISPICKVDMDSNMVGTSKKYKGYLRLRLRETKTKQIPSTGKISQTNSDSDSIDSLYNRPRTADLKLTPEYETFDLLNIYRDSNSSGIDVSMGGESDYAYITSLNTNHPLNDLIQSNRKIYKIDGWDSRALPETCMTNVKYVIQNNDDDDDDVDNDDIVSKSDGDFSDSELNDTIELKYLNSKQFLSYFANLLRDNLAQDLNLDENDFKDATWKGASINTKSYEIIPAIQVSCWPDCALEWKHRHRPIHINPNNDQQMQWPTQKMIHEIMSFGCHVIPLGYAPKSHKNPYRELEWKIVFPKAERYLEGHLTSTQVKIFMLTKVLIKTFLEPQQQQKNVFLFTTDNLRMHLFWQCEKNYGAFPEEFLGDALLRFLNAFLDCTRTKILRDYFVSGRNLFESIPENTLNRLHTVIAQIVQNPVIHIIMAYRNLEQIESFFPKLNYLKIYSIITIDNPLNLMDNKLKRNTHQSLNNIDIEPATNFENHVRTDNESDNNEDDLGLIGYSRKIEKKSIRRKSKRIRQQQRQLSIRRKLSKRIERRISVDSIDLQFICSKNLDGIERTTKKELRKTFDDIRRTLTIEVFIKHNIAMAKNFCHLKSLNYSKIYLNQAKHLCSLLRTFHYDELANKFSTNITKISEQLNELLSNNASIPDFRPALPKRISSLEPIKNLQQRRRQKQIVHVQINSGDNNKHRSVHFQEPTFYEPNKFNSPLSSTVTVEDPLKISPLNENDRKFIKSPGILKQTSFTKPLNDDLMPEDEIYMPTIMFAPEISETKLSVQMEVQADHKIHDNSDDQPEEIDETGKNFSEIFQLRKQLVHRLLKDKLMLPKTMTNYVADSTDL